MSENLLEVHSLKTIFETSEGTVRAVDGVNLRVGRCQRVGLVGESGSGKSMTALSVMRLVPPPGKIVEGRVLFEGTNLLELSEHKMRAVRGKNLSMVFQDPMTFLNPVMKVSDQIAESIRLHQRKAEAETRQTVLELVEKVGVRREAADSYPHQLSGGMRQRMLIAMAIACNPSVLIADEPTTALDATTQVQILDLLKNVTEELRTSVLLVTHDLGIVADFCDVVNVMYAGRILESADVFSLFDAPAHPYTRALLESALSVDQFKKKLVAIEGTVPDLLDLPKGCRFNPRCKFVTDKCKINDPPLVEIGTEHRVACWLVEENS